MPRYFLPKKLYSELSEAQMEKLKQKFGLSEGHMPEVEYWNDPHSPYAGTIINTEPNAQYRCYPYDKNADLFIEEYNEIGDGIANAIITANDLE